MTDFFSNLGSGIRFPDARIGGSTPLPTSLSGPAGINGTLTAATTSTATSWTALRPTPDPTAAAWAVIATTSKSPIAFSILFPKFTFQRANI